MEVQELRWRAIELAAGNFSPMPAHNLTWLNKVPSGHGRTRWYVLGCLYAADPRYRLHSQDVLSVPERRAVKQEISRITLPRQMVSWASRPDAAQRYKRCAQFSTTHGVPMGMYLTGRFFPGGGAPSYVLSALWSFSELDAAWTLSLLQQAVRETR